MDSGSGSEQGGMPELWSIVEAAHARVRNPRISIAEPLLSYVANTFSD